MKTRRKKPIVVWLLAALISDVSFTDAVSGTTILNNVSLALKLFPYTDDSVVQLGLSCKFPVGQLELPAAVRDGLAGDNG